MIFFNLQTDFVFVFSRVFNAFKHSTLLYPILLIYSFIVALVTRSSKIVFLFQGSYSVFFRILLFLKINPLTDFA